MISALDNHLLRAYLDGEMDEAAAEAFEILMIERPELAELVDADTALQMGLKPAQAAASEPAAAVSANVVSLPNRERTQPPRWAPLLTAASVLLAVGVGLGRWWSPQPPELVPTTLLSVDRLRSVGDTPKLRLPASGQIVLSVPVAPKPGCTPLIRIAQSGSTLQAQAVPDDYGFANLGLAATRLAPGKAEVSVVCGAEEVARYPVEFVR